MYEGTACSDSVYKMSATWDSEGGDPCLCRRWHQRGEISRLRQEFLAGTRAAFLALRDVRLL